MTAEKIKKELQDINKSLARAKDDIAEIKKGRRDNSVNDSSALKIINGGKEKPFNPLVKETGNN